MIRTLAEYMSRGVILRKRLPGRFGDLRIFVSPESRLRYWWSIADREESHLFDWVSEFVKPGSVVWDVGASVGLFSFSAAVISGEKGHVISIEADPFTAGLLRRTLKKAPKSISRVKILELAVCDTVGCGTLEIARRSRNASHLSSSQGSSQTGGVRERISVITTTLDLLLDDHKAPDILKIDVEGCEKLVLEGGSKMLSVVRPTILCEVGGENQTDVTNLLSSFGYTLFDLETPAARRVAIEKACWNTLALPGKN